MTLFDGKLSLATHVCIRKIRPPTTVVELKKIPSFNPLNAAILVKIDISLFLA